MISSHLLKDENGGADFRVKVFLLVLSVMVPFLVINTIILRGLFHKVTTAISGEDHMSMALSGEEHTAVIGKEFFSIFVINGFMAAIVAALGVSIAFWIVGPWRKLSRKIIQVLGKGPAPPQGENEIEYAMNLLDRINIPRE